MPRRRHPLRPLALAPRSRNVPVMETANTVRIDPTKHSGAELRVFGDRVSRLWNAGNYRCRQGFIAKEGVPTGSRLEDLMKDTPEYRQLPSGPSGNAQRYVVQEVLKKLSEAWKSYFKLRAKWREAPRSTRSRACPGTARTATAASGRST
jgi:hypothetical protein